MTIVVKTSDGNEKEFIDGRKYKFSFFGGWLYICNWAGTTLAIFKTRGVVGFWEKE